MCAALGRLAVFSRAAPTNIRCSPRPARSAVAMHRVRAPHGGFPCQSGCALTDGDQLFDLAVGGTPYATMVHCRDVPGGARLWDPDRGVSKVGRFRDRMPCARLTGSRVPAWSRGVGAVSRRPVTTSNAHHKGLLRLRSLTPWRRMDMHPVPGNIRTARRQTPVRPLVRVETTVCHV